VRIIGIGQVGGCCKGQNKSRLEKSPPLSLSNLPDVIVSVNHAYIHGDNKLSVAWIGLSSAVFVRGIFAIV
jgi:hypothetical protein